MWRTEIPKLLLGVALTALGGATFQCVKYLYEWPESYHAIRDKLDYFASRSTLLAEQQDRFLRLLDDVDARQDELQRVLRGDVLDVPEKRRELSEHASRQLLLLNAKHGQMSAFTPENTGLPVRFLELCDSLASAERGIWRSVASCSREVSPSPADIRACKFEVEDRMIEAVRHSSGLRMMLVTVKTDANLRLSDEVLETVHLERALARLKILGVASMLFLIASIYAYWFLFRNFIRSARENRAVEPLQPTDTTPMASKPLKKKAAVRDA